MANYENIFNIISIILLLTILVVVLFGCHYKGCRSFEGFEGGVDVEDKPKEEKKEKSKDEKKEEKKDNQSASLSTFEKSVLDGLTTGSLTTDGLSSLIKEEKFTPTNLDNLIQYVEHFKGFPS